VLSRAGISVDPQKIGQSLQSDGLFFIAFTKVERPALGGGPE
jgi:hypothetical protein